MTTTAFQDAIRLCEKLEAFKNYVHQRLDAMGIEKEPNGKHSANGCRIGDRLDLLEERIKQAEEIIGYITNGQFICRKEKWFWYEEIWVNEHGPYDNAQLAYAAFTAYCKQYLSAPTKPTLRKTM